jgi:hypothetical protein
VMAICSLIPPGNLAINSKISMIRQRARNRRQNMTPQVVSAQAFTGDHAAQHLGDKALTETPRNVEFLARCRVIEKFCFFFCF